MIPSSRGWTPLLPEGGTRQSTGVNSELAGPVAARRLANLAPETAVARRGTWPSRSSLDLADGLHQLLPRGCRPRQPAPRDVLTSSKRTPRGSFLMAHTQRIDAGSMSTPTNSSAAPHGICTGTGRALRRLSIILQTLSKSAPDAVHLVDERRSGAPYLSAWRQTVSDWGSTPPTAQNTATAPSSTRSDRSTSAVKVDVPGVSMMLMRWSSPVQRGGGRGDGDAALLLLGHPVHRRGAVVDLTHLVS